MMDAAHPLDRAPFMGRLFESVEDEPGMRCGADTPADELASIGVDEVGASLGVHPTRRRGRVAGTYEKSVTGPRYGMAYAPVPEPSADGASVVIVRVVHTSEELPPEEWPQ